MGHGNRKAKSVIMLRLSTKQKREVYSISSLLLHLIIFIALLVSLNSCGLTNPEAEVAPDTCTTLATVKDMRGLDGCGFILVLDNGEKLEPINNGRIQQPATTLQIKNCWVLPQADPALADGQRVKIGYKEVSGASICMIGKTVELTCITVVSTVPAPLH